MQKKIFDNIRKDTKESTFAFSFDRDLDKLCYTEPNKIYDLDSSDDEKARLPLSKEEIDIAEGHSKIELIGDQHKWRMKPEKNDGNEDCLIRYHKHLI